MKIIASFALIVPSVLAAQDAALPDYAYDMVAEISMATTAAQTCDGAKLNDRKLQKAMLDMMGKLVADGFDPVVSVQYFDTPDGKEKIALREAALRARHGVDAEGAEALCAAIRAEIKINKTLGKIVKMR